jgi:hypothetical protein
VVWSTDLCNVARHDDLAISTACLLLDAHQHLVASLTQLCDVEARVAEMEPCTRDLAAMMLSQQLEEKWKLLMRQLCGVDMVDLSVACRRVAEVWLSYA